jgi:hypothetical protein
MRDKIFLVLVWRGLKKASALSLDILSKKDETALMEKIKKAGLSFLKTQKMIEGEDRGLRLWGTLCFVADNQKDLDSISDLWSRKDKNNLEIDRRLGYFSGYPSTAIDAYIKLMNLPKSERIDAEKTIIISPKEKIDLLKSEPDLIPFSLLFHMSREHWKSELETVRKWSQELELVTRGLRAEFIDNFKKSHSV